MYTCTHIHTSHHAHVHMYTYTHVTSCTCTHIHTSHHAHVHMYTHTYVTSCTCTHMHTSHHAHIHTSHHSHIHTSHHAHVHTCTRHIMHMYTIFAFLPGASGALFQNLVNGAILLTVRCLLLLHVAAAVCCKSVANKLRIFDSLTHAHTNTHTHTTAHTHTHSCSHPPLSPAGPQHPPPLRLFQVNRHMSRVTCHTYTSHLCPLPPLQPPALLRAAARPPLPLPSHRHTRQRACHVSCVTCHASCGMCDVSRVTCHVSCVMCNVLPVTCNPWPTPWHSSGVCRWHPSCFLRVFIR